MPRRRPYDREIAALAVPALGALVAEPLFLATDTALVGHLGAEPLAALGIAGTVLQTAVGLLVFLAYATTPAVARRIGAGDLPGALTAGIDGLWLALVVGAGLVAVGLPGAPLVVGWFGADAGVAQAAADYLRIAVWGLPAMLLVIAATGLFRGLQDTRTPLWIAVAGFTANGALNALLIYGAGWGLVGSAVGTALAQWGMAAAAIAIAVRHARRNGVGLLPGRAGILRSAGAGGWLLLRTASLRVALVATVAVATAHGTASLAATQVLFTLFALVALALDSLAIAGQAMIGHALGSGDTGRVRGILRRLLEIGVLGGVGLAVLLAAVSPVLGRVFTNDEAVLAALPGGILVLALGLPVGAVVFVLDGVLIGAGDARYLAWTGLVNLAAVLPLLVLVGTAELDAVGAVIAVQAVFAVGYMLARVTTLGLRVRGGRWMVTGHR
ncbi:MATE family efflux transporter [Homoserinibacter sp. YIM 151385]|uniref:MATE family efflux transporter n=1 Tax=Homoserinibacter sp. YIM 151385 TaxID=2985506 RepID=UPI0022F121AC|nr:MATE family efflux transporter [Homoserinibacter sp. YIM 151385]WBU37190.1 MATE family efflux transporter [Homoserinibacter sp. YIM 151385]